MTDNIKKYTLSNGYPVYQGRIFKYKGNLLDKGRSFYIKPLTVKDCAAMEDLSVCIYENLKEGQECFIHKHDRDYYRNILADENSDVKYVGVFAGRELIAMSYFRIAGNDADLKQEMPGHKLDIFSAKRDVKDIKVAAFGSDSVHPDYRGNSLNKIMIEYRMNFSEKLGATDWVSIIDRKNVWNMNPYFGNGFNMFASSIDPADNGEIALMHKPVKEKVEYKDNNFEFMHFANQNTIDKMFYMKRIGIDYDAKMQKIVFAKTDYYANLKKNRGNEVNNVMMQAGKYKYAER